MASKSSSLALFFILNVLFLALVASACDSGCGSDTKPKHEHKQKHKPTPSSSPSSGSSSGKCPIDTLKLGVCANVLNGLLDLTIGKPPKEPCCGLIKGLVDLEAAACLCTAIKADVLGLNLNVPISLSLLLNYCGHNVPSGFQCA